MRSVTARNRTGAICLALASGLVLGMNTFARIPNVLGFACILLIPIGAAIYRRKHMWQSVAASFAAGWIAGVALVLAAMLALNHFSIFASNMSDLFGIASSADGEASHGISHLIRAQIDSYLIVGRVAAKLLAIGIMLWCTYKFVPHTPPHQEHCLDNCFLWHGILGGPYRQHIFTRCIISRWLNREHHFRLAAHASCRLDRTCHAVDISVGKRQRHLQQRTCSHVDGRCAGFGVLHTFFCNAARICRCDTPHWPWLSLCCLCWPIAAGWP